ncbi:MAG: phage tail tape measure protein, partial [Rikenellaceae bacterium]
MANKVKIFGIEIQFGKSEEDLTKVSQLLTTVINKTTSLKKMWTEYMTTISSSKELSQVIALLKQLETVSASATKAKKTLTAEERVANAEMREARKEEDLKIKSEKSHQGSINQLKADIALLNITWNKMSKEQRESTAEGKLMTTQLKSMRSELRNAKLDAGDFTSNIGNYMSGLYNKTTAMVTGIVAGLYTIKRGITALYSDYQDLEYRMAMVQAISGATADEFERLTLNAKLLGGTTEYTATEVAGLQLAYSRMGFVPDQILEMTSATLDLATATGEDLAQSADIAGTVIRGFNLDAEESGRVVDVMAKSFNSSSLQLDSFYEAMKYVAPVATAANVTLEETTAMLGVLADRGIRGSQAGTALRTIFLQMAADGGSVTDRLAELSDQGLELGDALDEVGKRAVTSLMVLAGSKSSVDTLTLGLNDAEGAAKSAADTIRDTLQGDVDNFTSALEARMISIGTYLAPLGRNVVQFGTTVVRELGSISKAIATGTSAWLAYNVAMKWSAYWSKIVAANKGAATLATTIETAMVSKNTTEIIINSAATSKASTLTKALAIAKLLLAGNTAAATVAMKALSVSIASTGVGLLVVGLASAISYFAFFRKGADDATSAQDKFNKSQDEFNKKLDERRSRINDLIAIVKDETKTDTQQYLAFEELKKIIPDLT